MVLTRRLDELSGKNNLLIENIHKVESGYADPFDWAAFNCQRDIHLRMRERECILINEIIDALEKIQDGTYGICEECQEAISEKRLRASPITTLCIDCKTRQEEREKKRKRYSLI
ncbi:MAG: TraR/DksA C4-type zinc finger protein [Deltaproteobacteria bacterium]|nr:TraR/DksA C4-type zinc finger protein [Deltaproteobacteria bacterium]